ncbi:response regulator [Colwelliaceae bacterium 6441]
MNILIIDDHPLFIDGISHVLNGLSEKTHIIKATSGVTAIEQLALDIDFDLILLDLNMPDLGGISLLQRFKADELCVPVVIISSEEQAGLIRETLDWGVMGFIPKSYSSEKILNALTTVLEGNIYIPESVQVLLSRLASYSKSDCQMQAIQKSGITNKQMEVLNLLAQGHSNEKISTILHRTEHTVKSHVSVLFQVLGAKNRTECVKIAEKRGLLS